VSDPCGRVVRVRPRPDGSYAVTIGTGARTIYWLRTSEPLRIGDLVVLRNAVLRTGRLQGTVEAATLSVVEQASVEVMPDLFARRLVSPLWLRRVGTSMRRPLFPHQAEGAAWLADRLTRGRGSILADEMGLGKTATVIAAMLAARALPAIVVCPSPLKATWQREMRYARLPFSVAAVERVSGPLPRAHVVLVNYDILRAREKDLLACGAKLLICDEAHALKEPTPSDGHRAAVATRLARAIRRVVLLTGTPILNRPAEYWRLLYLVDSAAWPDYEAFRSRYCTAVGEDVVSTDHGAVSNVVELRCLVDEVVLRRTKADLLRELPPKERRVLTTELGPRDKAHYDAAERDVVKWLKDTGKTAEALTAAKGEALVKLTMLRHIAARGKVRASVGPFLQGWLGNHPREPLVVFGFHRDVLRGVRVICTRLGLSCGLLDSMQSTLHRQREIERWQCGASQVLIAPLRIGGVGLNLQRASHALVLERLWSPYLMEQAEDRLHRIGQPHAVTIWYLDANVPIDAHLAEVGRDKRTLIGAVMDESPRTSTGADEHDTVVEVAAKMAGLPSNPSPEPTQ
jgi:SNF2 family DNA or RNA helicase